MTVRRYSSISIDTTLATGIGTSDTTITVVSGTGSTLMGGVTLVTGDQFTVTLDPDTVNEEVVFITAQSGDTFTITRARAGTTAVAHAAGAGVRHVLSSDDLIAFENTNLTALTTSNVAVVTNKDLSSTTNTFPNSLATLTGTQTLTNKTLTNPSISGPSISGTISINGSTGTNGQVLQSTGTGIQWGGSVIPAFNGASVYNSTNTSTTSGVSQYLTFDSEQFDTNSYHSTSSNTDRLTVPTTGYYRINASIRWQQASGGPSDRVLFIQSSSYGTVAQVYNTVAAAITFQQNVELVQYLPANSYIQIGVQQISGGALNVVNGNNATWAQIQYLGS